jgi:rhodanese-related sulfurtransferase
MKRLIIEVMIIVVVASLVGFLYNAFQASPLPLIPAPLEERQIPDSVVFNKSYEATFEDLELTLTYEQMKEIVGNPDFLIIDARRPEQYQEAHIGDAINIFPEYDDEAEYVGSIFQIPQDKTIIVYCDGGTCDLSNTLAKELIHFGFKNLFIYHGGWEEWTKNQAQ